MVDKEWERNAQEKPILFPSSGLSVVRRIPEKTPREELLQRSIVIFNTPPGGDRQRRLDRAYLEEYNAPVGYLPVLLSPLPFGQLSRELKNRTFDLETLLVKDGVVATVIAWEYLLRDAITLYANPALLGKGEGSEEVTIQIKPEQTEDGYILKRVSSEPLSMSIVGRFRKDGALLTSFGEYSITSPTGFDGIMETLAIAPLRFFKPIGPRQREQVYERNIRGRSKK